MFLHEYISTGHGTVHGYLSGSLFKLVQALSHPLSKGRDTDTESRLGGIRRARMWTQDWLQPLFAHSLKPHTSNGSMWHHYGAGRTWRRPLLSFFVLAPPSDFFPGFFSVKGRITPFQCGKKIYLNGVFGFFVMESSWPHNCWLCGLYCSLSGLVLMLSSKEQKTPNISSLDLPWLGTWRITLLSLKLVPWVQWV